MGRKRCAIHDANVTSEFRVGRRARANSSFLSPHNIQQGVLAIINDSFLYSLSSVSDLLFCVVIMKREKKKRTIIINTFPRFLFYLSTNVFSTVTFYFFFLFVRIISLHAEMLITEVVELAAWSVQRIFFGVFTFLVFKGAI